MRLDQLRRGQRFTVEGLPWRTGKLLDKTTGAALVQFDGQSGPVPVSLGTPVDITGNGGNGAATTSNGEMSK